MGQGNSGGFAGKGGAFAGGVSGQAASFFGQGSVANAMGGTRMVQEVDGGMMLDEWFASQADLGVGLDGYFTTLGGKVLNSKVGISSLGLGSFQEVVFHCRLRGGANKGSGRVDSPNLGEWQCSF